MLVLKAARICAMGFKSVFSKSWSSSTKRQNKSVEGQNRSFKKLNKKRTRNNKSNYKSTEYIEPSAREVGVEFVDMSDPATSLVGNNATTTTATIIPTSITSAGVPALAASNATTSAIIAKTPEKNDAGERKGWLLKWTNYIKGYQRRWFVLSKGVLSYYRNQAEINHTCRGTISLHGALIHTVDSCTFVISNGGTQTFHIKAANEVERQSWVTALELAKAKAISAMENEEEEENETAHVVPSEEINTVVRDLTERLENLRTCYDLIVKHGVALQRALSDLESNDEEPLAMRTKIVNERATLFRITSNAMINACSDYLRTADSQGHKWSKMLQHEREQRQHLEEMVELMAKQHTRLEQAAHLVQHNKSSSATAVLINAVASSTAVVSDEEIEFFDAEDSQSDFFRTSLERQHTAGSGVPVVADDDDDDDNNNDNAINGDDYEQAHMSNSSSDEDHKENYKSSGNGVKTHTYNHPPRNELEKQQGNNYYELDPVTKNPLVASAHSGNPFPGNPNNSVSKCSCCTCDTSFCSKSCSCNDCCKTPTTSRDAVDKVVAVRSTNDVIVGAEVGNQKRKRRTRVPDKPNYPLNLWSIMKNCIGKDLSKIPMPVNFNEPLSMLQRLTEDYEYANILDEAARCEDECEQLAYVAAFTISSYSTTVHRTGKPFNPLLGETYECDRTDDLGWRCISEQVSHHPPMAAIHCEGSEWICWQEFTMSSKFRGKYVQVIPLGGAHVKFPASGHKYSWRKVTTTVNNIIVGKLWVDQHGDMEITGSNTAQGLKCLLKYIPYSYFSREQQRRVKGVIINRQNQAKWVLRGTWDERIEIAPVLSVTGGSINSDSAIFKTGPYKTVWQCRPPPPDSDKYYNFTVLACQLNEMEEGVAPTDSRHRPDQRLMELGRWDESNAEKIRLEEKQRRKRRIRESEAEAAAAQGKPFAPYEPVWFGRVREEGTDNYVHEYKGTYWKHKEKQDWSQCPDLF